MKRLRYRNGTLDAIDATLIAALADNARISIAELSRQVGLSSPGVSERIKRLEEAGVIRGYTIDVDAAALGQPIAAWLRIRPLPGQLEKVARILDELPEIIQCDRITGDDCFLARAVARSVIDLEKLIDKIIPWSMTNTSIIQSTTVARRLPPIPDEARSVRSA